MNESEGFPLVSIIIPYFNHGEFIHESLESISIQNYPNLEVLVIDDCSTKSSAKESLEKFNAFEIKILQTNINSGPSVARNLGIEKASGKYILPLDGDDKLGEPFIGQAVKEMEDNHSIHVVYGNGQKFGMVNETLNLPNFEKFNFLTYNPLFVTALFRKSALESVGNYDTYLSKLGLEDWDLWLSFAEMDFTFKKLDRCFLQIRVLENSRTFQVANKNIDPIFDYIYTKHKNLILKEYKLLLAQNIDLKRSREYTLGRKILAPLRKLYSLFKN